MGLWVSHFDKKGSAFINTIELGIVTEAWWYCYSHLGMYMCKGRVWLSRSPRQWVMVRVAWCLVSFPRLLSSPPKSKKADPGDCLPSSLNCGRQREGGAITVAADTQALVSTEVCADRPEPERWAGVGSSSLSIAAVMARLTLPGALHPPFSSLVLPIVL